MSKNSDTMAWMEWRTMEEKCDNGHFCEHQVVAWLLFSILAFILIHGFFETI